MLPISNLNSVLIKNYGQKQETLAVIRELAKLGLIKKKSKSKKERKTKMIEDLKQESDLIGYTKTLEGNESGNFPLRILDSSMSQKQIEDINRTNVARFAQLEAAATQQQRQIGGLAGLAQGFFSVINPAVERFRGSTFPAQSSGSEPVDPFASRRPGVIYLGDIPETSSGSQVMTESLNPNAPMVMPEVATTVFPEEETGNIRQGLEPREKMGGSMSTATAEMLGLSSEFVAKTKPEKTKTKLVRDPQDSADELRLGKIPTMRNGYETIEKFYIALTDQIGDRDASLNSKSLILEDIDRILKGYFG